MKQRIPKFDTFIEEQEKLEEDGAVGGSFSSPAASLQNTPGMGNVSMPNAAGKIGSGDTFTAAIAKKRKKKKRISGMSDSQASRDMTPNGNR